MADIIYDILVVGGGINGAGIAHYASQYGLKVYLCEKDDFASKTSSSSTKLLHGGLRYLENYEFGLVRSALQERNKLHDVARHIVCPLDFVLIHNPEMRSQWLVRIGLFIYDLLAGFSKRFKTTKTIDLLRNAYGNALDLNLIKKSYKKSKSLTAFIYNDLWVDDARLTVLNVLAAQQAGASVHKNTELLSAKYDPIGKLWGAHIKNNKTNSQGLIKAKLIINATGPWINNFLANNLKLKPNYNIRLVKGSHIVVPKLYSGTQCYVLQSFDRRLIFVIPYQDKYTLIGTTETEDVIGAQDFAEITESEKQYLLANSNAFFNKKITSQDIKWSYSGIRPLLDSGEKNSSKNTRDYLIEQYASNFDSGPLINIYGGKITTYRVLALKVVKVLMTKYKIFFNEFRELDPDKIFLPGSDILDFCSMAKLEDHKIKTNEKTPDFDCATVPKSQKDKYPLCINNYISHLQTLYPWLEYSFVCRLSITYGSEAMIILNNCKTHKDLGIHFGADLYAKEVDYLVVNEFADCSDDILWRRTKLGLELSLEEINALDLYLKSARG